MEIILNPNPSTVIVYGDSLIMEGVCASLAACPDLEIHWLDPAIEKPLEFIQAWRPAIFIFDLEAVKPEFQLALLHQPDLLLVGIDPVTHQCLVWTGRQEAAVVAADLIHVIHPKQQS